MNGSTKARDVGWLVLRVGVGIMFMVFGFGKLADGPERWVKLGGAMASFGITFAPTFWGFMAAFAEFFGGLALALGILFRPSAFLLFFTMLTATVMLVKSGAGLIKYSHALNMAIVFMAALIAGSGGFALGSKIPGLKGKWWQ